MPFINRSEPDPLVIAARSVHVDDQGRECAEDHPRVAVMVCAAGTLIPESVARQYGLIPEAEPVEGPAPAKKRRAPKES